MKTFRWRRVVSLALLLLASVLTYTGVVLYIAPQGRIAFWTDWHFLGLDKEQLSAIHTVSSFVFVLLGWLHTWFNWKPILAYLRGKASGLRALTPELGVATLLVLVVVVGAGLSLPPFAQVVAGGEAMKAWWEDREGSPPFGHAELSSLSKMARRLGLDPQVAVEALEDEGVEVLGTADTLAEIAAANDSSPAALYRLLEERASAP
jgi:hypothetical protein